MIKPFLRRVVGWRTCLGMAVSLALAEVLLRFGFPYFVEFVGAPGFGTYAPTLARLLYAYHNGNYSMLPVETDLTVHDPHRGFRMAPNLRSRNLGAGTTSSNSLGSRGQREYERRKPDNVTRAIALGDSFTFGFGIDDDGTWPAQLEASVPNLEVINFGMGAYAHDQMYFALVDDGLPLQPDVVILGFFENDVWRDDLLYYAYEKPRFDRTLSGWTVSNIPILKPAELRDRYLSLPLAYTVPRALLETLLRPPWSVDADGERATEILRRTREATERAGARFVIVNLPDLMRPLPASDSAQEKALPPPPPGFFYTYCAQSGSECVDTWPWFWKEAGTRDQAVVRARYLRPGDIHYSAEGYRIVADVLRRHFQEHTIKRVDERPPVTRPEEAQR